LTRPLPDFDPEHALLVGRVLAPHGLRGELKVYPLTDFPERFEPGSHLWLRGEPVVVQASRWQRGTVFLKLGHVSDRPAAQALAGAELHAPEDPSLPEEGQFFRHDILGLSVRVESGETLGEVVDILVTGANDVYVVHGERGELLVPALDDVVKEVDLDRREMVVDLMEGMEFTPPRGRR
jgi:16S rRNA processing protein RimM